MKKKVFIRNTVKRLSFENIDTFACFATSSLDTRYYFNVYTFFLQEPVKLDSRFTVLKFFMVFRAYCS